MVPLSGGFARRAASLSKRPPVVAEYQRTTWVTWSAGSETRQFASLGTSLLAYGLHGKSSRKNSTQPGVKLAFHPDSW
jgi:hypothetical protein